MIETNLFPNPSNGNSTLQFYLPKSSNIEIVIYDILGNKIEVVENEHCSAGKYLFDLNVSDYISGIYTISITTDYSKSIEKLIINR